MESISSLHVETVVLMSKKDKSEFSNYRVGEHCYARKINRTFSCQLISRQHRYSRIIQLERQGNKIPRIEVSDCKRDDIQELGVYFLFCKMKKTMKIQFI